MSLVAFRCKNCGRLHPAGHAGDNLVPHACQVCGKGVSFGPDFKEIAARLSQPDLSKEERLKIASELSQSKYDKSYHPENWEVLADLSPEQLAKYDLKPEHVERHVPVSKDNPNLNPSFFAVSVKKAL